MWLALYSPAKKELYPISGSQVELEGVSIQRQRIAGTQQDTSK
jgi:hypothetical protein